MQRLWFQNETMFLIYDLHDINDLEWSNSKTYFHLFFVNIYIYTKIKKTARSSEIKATCSGDTGLRCWFLQYFLRCLLGQFMLLSQTIALHCSQKPLSNKDFSIELPEREILLLLLLELKRENDKGTIHMLQITLES